MSKDKNIDERLRQEEYIDIMISNFRYSTYSLNLGVQHKHRITRSDIVDAIVCDWFETYQDNPDAQKRMLDQIINK